MLTNFLYCPFLIITFLVTFLCSDHVMNSQDVSKHSFLEIGAAALLVGDVEAKMKGELWRSFGAVDMPFFDKLLQTSLLTTVTNSASARSHMKAITASKRSKTGSLQIWHVFFTQPATLKIYYLIQSFLNIVVPSPSYFLYTFCCTTKK